MDMNEFNKVSNRADLYAPSDIQGFTFMTDEEIEGFEYEVELDSGDYSNWDVVRYILTMRKKIAGLKEERDFAYGLLHNIGLQLNNVK